MSHLSSHLRWYCIVLHGWFAHDAKAATQKCSDYIHICTVYLYTFVTHRTDADTSCSMLFFLAFAIGVCNLCIWALTVHIQGTNDQILEWRRMTADLCQVILCWICHIWICLKGGGLPQNSRILSLFIRFRDTVWNYRSVNLMVQHFMKIHNVYCICTYYISLCIYIQL